MIVTSHMSFLKNGYLTKSLDMGVDNCPVSKSNLTALLLRKRHANDISLMGDISPQIELHASSLANYKDPNLF